MNDYDEDDELLEIYEKEGLSDYFIKLYRGLVLPLDHPSYNDDRVEIEIYDREYNENGDYKIKIDGQQYKMNQIIFDKIKTYIDENIRMLIDLSIAETTDFLRKNGYYGGISGSIRIKYGQLLVSLDGQAYIYDEKVNKVIEDIIDIITNNQY